MKEIEYYRPKFTRKLAASFMDAFIFSLLSLLFVVISKAIGDVTPTYKQNSSELDTIKLDSGLFLEDNDGLVRDVVTIYNLDTETNSSVVEKEVVNSINNFFTYVDNNLSHELYESMIKEFDELRLDQKLIYSYEGNTYKLFIQKDGKVVPIEVKSGNTRANSLKSIMKNNKDISYGYKFIDGNVGTSEEGIITLPLYMIAFFDKVSE